MQKLARRARVPLILSATAIGYGCCRKWDTIGTALACVFAMLLCVSGCGPQGREKGVQEAKAAITTGKLKLKEYPPLPSPPGHNEYVALLREKCGVEYEVINAPGSSEELKREVRGWNDTMEAEIRRKFGQDILQQLHDEAKTRWQGKPFETKKRSEGESSPKGRE